MIYKEALLLKSGCCRIFVELIIPLTLSLILYSALNNTNIKCTNNYSFLKFGYQSSSEEYTAFTLFKSINHWCHGKYYAGLVINDVDLRSRFEKVLASANTSYREFADVNALKEDALKKRGNYDGLCVGISLEKKDKKYSYSIYTNKDFLPQDQESIYDPYKWVLSEANFGNIQIVGDYQAMLDSFILKEETKNNSAYVAYAYSPMVGKQVLFETIANVISGLVYTFAFVIMLAALTSLVYLISRMQMEKCNKMRDFLRMMGMSDTPYYMSHFTFMAITYFVTATIISVTMGYIALKNTNLIVIWISTYLVLISMYPLAILLNSFLQSPQIAKAICILSFISAYIILLPITLEAKTAGTKFALSLFSPLAYALSLENMFNFDARGQLGFTDITRDFYAYSVAKGWGIMLLDMVIYTLLGLYFDNVLPGVGGVRRPWNFFLTSTYWCPTRHLAEQAARDEGAFKTIDGLIEEKGKQDLNVNMQAFENVDANLRAQEDNGECLTIRNMTKVYGDGKLAVNKVSLNIYKGQVFILLGHNGAGKTTSLSMLTGLLSPTSGTAKFRGIDIFLQLDRLRGMLGICPQESIFYDNLTVNQHLNIMSMLKGVTNLEAERGLIDGLMSELDMRHTLNTPAGNLSGGEKRKLSLIMALMGNPQILMLDEPTSGLDATARQKVWTIIKRIKNNCVILMTTHYMDEAEKVGERIAIMGEGEIRCCGSPLFLKNHYGTGYNLSLVKVPGVFVEKSVDEFMYSHIDSRVKISEGPTEIMYRLPFESASKFPDLFSDLDKFMMQLGISSYGVAITSLEDVFLKVGSTIHALNPSPKIPTEEYKKVEINMKEEEDLPSFMIGRDGTYNPFMKMWTIFWSVWLTTVRTAQLIICEVVLPIFICCLAFMSIPYGSSYDYTYGPKALPSGQEFLINNETYDAQSTSFFYDLAPGYKSNAYHIENPYDIDDVVERVNNLSITKFANSDPRAVYYIDSVTPTELQVFIQSHAGWTHGPTLFANIIMRKYLEKYLPGVEIEPTIRPIKYWNGNEEYVDNLFKGVIFLLCTIIAFAIPPSSFCYSAVKDREEGRKFFLTLNGMGLIEYWIGKFITDVTKLIPWAFIVILISANTSIKIKDFSLIFIVSLLSSIPFAYLVGHIFTKQNTALAVNITLNIVIAILLGPTVTGFTLDARNKNIATKFDWVLRVIPIYNFSTTIIKSYISIFDPKAITENILGNWTIMILSSMIGSFALIAIIEIAKKLHITSGIGAINELQANQLKDNDVIEEENKMLSVQNPEPMIKVVNVRKLYGTFMAVNNVSFGVNKGDVFALIGVNGAGKTTTFRMLTREFKPTCGRIQLNQINALSGAFDKLRGNIGYCPQDNIIFDNLTVMDHLILFAEVKGIPSSKRRQVINDLVQSINFGENLNKKACNLSGGNKRKLCMAIAILGNPAVLLLDEPTTGLDPKNRRDMWKIISNASRFAGTVISTHSMEEVESLSTKVGIMARGVFRCFGPVQHLKNKYGNTYGVEIKPAVPKPDAINHIMAQLAYSEDRQINNMQEFQRITQTLGISEYIQQLVQTYQGAFGILQSLRVGLAIKARILVEFALYEKSIEETISQLTKIFCNIKVTEITMNKVSFLISRRTQAGETPLSQVFASIERIKIGGFIEDYAVYQTTIEQIFHQFAYVDQIMNQAPPVYV